MTIFASVFVRLFASRKTAEAKRAGEPVHDKRHVCDELTHRRAASTPPHFPPPDPDACHLFKVRA